MKQELQSSLDRAGLTVPQPFGSRTPMWYMQRIRRAQAREIQQLRFLWLSAVYTALALHAPERLPEQPWGAPEEGGCMPPEEMKRRLGRQS